MRDTISIIIPVLNEEDQIGHLLQYLLKHSSSIITEIMVVDGGSTDQSKAIIKGFEQVILIDSPKGRAKQMNTAATAAKGDILYFLHADTYPPKGFEQLILKETQLGNAAGCFRLKFSDPNHFILKIAPWFTKFKSALFRGGDASLFIRKEDFESLGGFNERYVIYEDVEFIHRISKRFTFSIIDAFVHTSERKFKINGTWKLYFHFLMIHLKYWIGASPEHLHAYYIAHIKG